jgi:hypothetical protein
MAGMTDELGRFLLHPNRNAGGTAGTADDPVALYYKSVGILVDDDGHYGLFAPVNWQQVVNGNWRAVASRQEITIQAVHSGSGAPIVGAEIRLLPRFDIRSLIHFPIDAFEVNPELGQAKYRVLKDSEWSASVRLPDSKSELSYPVTIDATNVVRIKVDLEPRVRVLLLDLSGVPVPNVYVSLRTHRGEAISGKSDEDGRAAILVQADESYALRVSVAKWQTADRDPIRVKARPDVYEIRIARAWWMSIALHANGVDLPQTSLIAYFDGSSTEHLYFQHFLSSFQKVLVNETYKRAIVLAPGCQPTEVPLGDGATTDDPPVKVEVKRGPTIELSRELLPRSFTPPLQWSATALHVAESYLGPRGKISYITQFFSTKPTPMEGALVLGPFAPGTYELKILDGDGKVLWEETREVKWP